MLPLDVSDLKTKSLDYEPILSFRYQNLAFRNFQSLVPTPLQPFLNYWFLYSAQHNLASWPCIIYLPLVNLAFLLAFSR